jgi:hypothetical protein
MARAVFTARMTPYTIASTALQTLVQIATPANQAGAWVRAKVSFQGVTVADKPVQLQLVTQTSSGVGGNTLTPVLVSGPAVTVQTVAQGGTWATSDPITTDIIDEVYVHPQTGYEWVFTETQDELTYFNSRRALRIAFPSGATFCTASCVVWWEE